MTTVCLQCRHFTNLDPNSPRARCWYNHLCQASPLPTKPDPYDGVEKPYARNDLGQEVFRDQPFDYCRNVNDGQCPKFEPMDRLH